MPKREKEKERKYACMRCGDPFTAFPPDDRHDIATRTESDYKDHVKVEYECKGCGFKNVLYWGHPGDVLVVG